MLTVRRYAEGKLDTGGLELLDGPGVKWMDVTEPTAEKLAPLAQRYNLHPLAIEDCLHLDQRPKLEEYPGHLFLVLHGFQFGPDVTDLVLLEHHFFIGPDWVITVHDLPSAACEVAAKRFLADPATSIGRGSDFLAYVIADSVVDMNFPLLDGLSDEMEVLEEKIFDRPRTENLQRIFDLKRALVMIRRVLSPQRDVVGLLARYGLPHVQERTTLYFRDIYDHLVRVYEQIDSARDLLGGVMEGYLSMVANRTNEITKQLTIFATIFLPLSFITGFFGQNFEVLSRPPFFLAMLVMVGMFPLALLVWFRRKGWL